MKALVYEGPETLGFREVTAPAPANPDDLLIRIEAVGICGSDMHAYLGHDSRRPAPLILGHEAAGIVVGGDRDGDRVTINPLVACKTCAACRAGRDNICQARQIISMPPREGAFAQFVSMPASNLVTVPDGFPLAKAALVEPLAVSWHAARLGIDALHPAMDRRALVIGGGAIGVAAVLALNAMEFDDITVIEPNAARAAYLERHLDAKVKDTADGSFPLVVDAVGIRATRQVASERVEAGGVIAHIGLGDGDGGLDIRRMTLQEITFIGTYTYDPDDFRATAAALFEGRLGPMDWYEERPLGQGAQAFADLHGGRVAAPKIVLRPWD